MNQLFYKKKIKQLQKERDALKQKNDALEQRVADLEAKGAKKTTAKANDK